MIVSCVLPAQRSDKRTKEMEKSLKEVQTSKSVQTIIRMDEGLYRERI